MWRDDSLVRYIRVTGVHSSAVDRVRDLWKAGVIVAEGPEDCCERGHDSMID
jgi:hypothetical protein